MHKLNPFRRKSGFLINKSGAGSNFHKYLFMGE
jgi:hypothetical protein